MSSQTNKTRTAAGKPTMNQFVVLVKLSIGTTRIRYERAGEWKSSYAFELARYERGGLLGQFRIALGTFRAIESRGWIKLVEGEQNWGYYTLSDLGRAVMQEMTDESTSFAEFADFIRRDQAEQHGGF